MWPTFTINYHRLLYRLRHDYLTLDNIVIAIAFFIAASWAWGSIQSMQRNYELQRQINAKKQQVAVETLETTLLEYEARYYNSTEYLDLAVRQRLGRAAPGERQLIVPSTNPATTPRQTAEPDNQPPSSNFQRWMDFLLGGRRSGS